MLSRGLTRLSSLVLRVRVAAARGSGTRVAVAMSRRLSQGDAFGATLKGVAPLFCEEALREACARFDGGPAALLLVDFRDALVRLFTEAGATLSQRHPEAGAWLPRQLGELASLVRGDDAVQRFVNCVLSQGGLCSEAQVLELERLDRQRLEAELCWVLTRVVSSRLSSRQAAQTLESLGAGYDFIDRLAKA